MFFLLSVSFIAGLAAILAPCIWPLLPIVLSTSASSSSSKPLGSVLGILTSFTIFTLAVSFLITNFGLNPQILRQFAALVLLALGLILVIPALSIRLEVMLSAFSSKLPIKPSQNPQNSFWGGYLTGLILGLVWSPCAAPILAIIATISATQTITLFQILLVLSFAVGLGIPLLVLALGGSYIFAKVRFLSIYTGKVQQIFGIIIIVTALMIYFNFDRQLQAKILDLFPAYSDFLGNIESLNK